MSRVPDRLDKITLIGYSAEPTALANCLARLDCLEANSALSGDHYTVVAPDLQLAQFIFKDGVLTTLEGQGALFSGRWPNWKHLQCTRQLAAPQDIEIKKISQRLALTLPEDSLQWKPAKSMLEEMTATKAKKEIAEAQKMRSTVMKALVKCRPNAL